MALPEEILINLAANLAAELITRAGGRLRDLAFGDAETRALGHAWQRAFQAMLEAVAADLSADDANLLADIWREFVAAEGVAGALLDLALAGDDPPLPKLRTRFDALFERATLAVDFDTALTALTRGLDAALLDEAEQPGSPLYNRVSLRRLAAMQRLLRQEAPLYRPGVPFQAPAVPRYFVPRPEVSAALMTYLTADAPHGALVVSAVHGLGGIGKTTLVAALAREPAVEARFPDGVLWATLGQTPDVLSLLAGWIQALGDYDFKPTVADSATRHLGTLLHDKACLLVVDDAWDAGHVRPFLAGGPRCRVLVTTRDAALARKVGAQLYDLDVMSEAQALALFEARLGPLGDDRQTAAALARELGCLPLALELAAAQVEAGCAWAELLALFRRELADLAALDLDEAEYRNESLRLSFRLSLERLAAEEQAAFAWLGMLPEDTRLNPAMAATLWECEEAGARKRLRRLRDRALLKPVGDDRYTLHDLLHDEARLRMAEEMPQPQAHARLLARYKHRHHIAYDQWYRLPDDGYIHERLAWHLEQAGQPEAVHALLRLETEEKRNAWYEAREALGQTAGYLDDVRRAWRLAEAQFLIPDSQFATRHSPLAIRNSQLAIGLQCRYALIVASLNSLATNLPPELIAALVKEKVWTPVQGLAYACRVSSPGQQSKTLVRLISCLPESLKSKALWEAIAAVQRIGNIGRRAEALAELAPHLTEIKQAEILRETLMATWKVEDEVVRSWTLADLVPHLSIDLVQEAIELVWKTGDEITWSWALVRLIRRFAELDCSKEALTAVRRIRDKDIRLEALVGLIPHLPRNGCGGALREALAEVKIILSEEVQSNTLVNLPPDFSESLCRGILVAMQRIRDEKSQLELLAGLILWLADLGCLGEALNAAQEVGNEKARSCILVRLSFYLSAGLLRQALVAAWRIENKAARSQALASLSFGLSVDGRAEILREALTTARKISDANDRAEALAMLALRLAELGCPEDALAAAREIESGNQRVSTLAELALQLPKPLKDEVLCEALAVAWKIGDEQVQAEALTKLLSHLPEPLQVKALWGTLATARGIENGWDRAKTLAGLALRLAELGYTEEALTVVREIEDGWTHASALTELALRLAELGCPAEALATVREIGRQSDRATALARLAPRLAELGYSEEALTMAREIEWKPNRAAVLSGLASHLPEPLKGQALQKALIAAREIENDNTRSQTLAELASKLMRLGYPEEALEVVQEIEEKTTRAEVLIGLVSYSPEVLLHQALSVTQEIKDEDTRSEVLVRLASRLPESLLRKALAVAQEIEQDVARSRALSGLIPRLAELGYLEEAMATTRRIREKYIRSRVLSKLLPYLQGNFLRQALVAIWEIGDEVIRSRVLAELGPYLLEVKQSQALYKTLAVAYEIKRADNRAHALIGLVSYLPTSEQASVLREVLVAAMGIEETDDRDQTLTKLVSQSSELGYLEEALAAAKKIGNSRSKAEALAGLAPRLPEAERAEALREALATARKIWRGSDRAKSLAELAPRLAELPVETLTSLWQETLPVLAAHTRKELLADLSALAPVIHALGGEAAIEETFRAVQDVGRWWE